VLTDPLFLPQTHRDARCNAHCTPKTRLRSVHSRRGLPRGRPRHGNKLPRIQSPRVQEFSGGGGHCDLYLAARIVETPSRWPGYGLQIVLSYVQTLGHATDFRSAERPWGFEIQDIKNKNRILIYHEPEDRATSTHNGPDTYEIICRIWTTRRRETETMQRCKRIHWS